MNFTLSCRTNGKCYYVYHVHKCMKYLNFGSTGSDNSHIVSICFTLDTILKKSSNLLTPPSTPLKKTERYINWSMSGRHDLWKYMDVIKYSAVLSTRSSQRNACAYTTGQVVRTKREDECNISVAAPIERRPRGACRRVQQSCGRRSHGFIGHRDGVVVREGGVEPGVKKSDARKRRRAIYTRATGVVCAAAVFTVVRCGRRSTTSAVVQTVI